MNHIRLISIVKQTALFSIGLGLLIASPLRADINSDLAFSAFSNVDLNALAGGKVLQARGGLVTFPRGIITQSLYVLDAAPATVADKLNHWNPASHSELKVWLHKSLPAQPKPSDFSDLANLPDNSSVNFQIDSTAKFDAGKPVFQLNKNETQLLTGLVSQEKDPKKLFADAWSQILSGRINSFLSGHAGNDVDIAPGGDIQPMSDVKNLLHSDTKVYGQYQRLLNQTPVKSLAGGTAGKSLPAELYYDIFDVQGSAAMGTGALFNATTGTSTQFLDVEYYTNYGVYTTVELEQIWPVTINGKQMTLVWRDDLVSAPNIAYLHGTERLASGMIMLQEVKQAIDAFRSEFK